MVDAGAGGQCAWRYTLLVAALEAAPAAATGALMSLWLYTHHRLPRPLDMALAGLTLAMGALTIIFVVLSAFNLVKEWQTDSFGVLQQAMYLVMGHPMDSETWTYFKQVCVCGYPGNWHGAMEMTTAIDGTWKIGYEAGFWMRGGCPYVPGLCDNPQDPATWHLHRAGACNVSELEAQYEQMMAASS